MYTARHGGTIQTHAAHITPGGGILSVAGPNRVARLGTAALAAVSWYALLLQLYVSITTAQATGIPVSTAILNYFSYFTILTNLLVALVTTMSWRKSSMGDLASRPPVQTSTAAYIATVGIVFSLLLRNLWNTEGLQKVANILLHDLIPILYVLYWLAWGRKSGLRFRNALDWLAYPVLYLAYSLIRGAFTGRYPYPFVDVAQLGYVRVGLNSLVLVMAFVGLSLLFIAVGRWMSRDSFQK
jgi:hypothetical protein